MQQTQSIVLFGSLHILYSKSSSRYQASFPESCKGWLATYYSWTIPDVREHLQHLYESIWLSVRQNARMVKTMPIFHLLSATRIQKHRDYCQSGQGVAHIQEFRTKMLHWKNHVDVQFFVHFVGLWKLRYSLCARVAQVGRLKKKLLCGFTALISSVTVAEIYVGDWQWVMSPPSPRGISIGWLTLCEAEWKNTGHVWKVFIP